MGSRKIQDQVISPADAGVLKTLGHNLADARKRVKLTQDDVGAYLGVAKETVSRWERGVNDPAYTQVQKLAGLYHVSLDWLSGVASHKTGLRPGYMIVNTDNLELLRAARKRRGTLRDIDKISSSPYVDVAWNIPEHLTLLNPKDAKELHHEIRTAVNELKRNTP